MFPVREQFYFQFCLLSFESMHTCSFFSLLCVFLLFPRAGALFSHGLIRCQLTPSHEAVYLEQIYFNKMLMMQYNSTLGKFVGYTENTKKIADNLNKNPAFLKQERKNVAKCTTHIPLVFDFLSKSVEPNVRLRSDEAASSRHPAILICSAYNFYPKHISLTWLRDGEVVTSGVMSTDVLSNGNWLYQIHTYLEYTPKPGEKITCKVKHVSLKEPKLYDWDPLSESQRNKIAVGTAGLVLGLVFLFAGLIYYKKNTTDRVLVPTS
ncbi:H-2 class II histocompatibility antigen, E-S beta chain isoform X1 [Lates calcarifer]|uniref:H-2 class II histocompatibility antigen, E-S beta chain isoform X1 n=1 Tax=Lates calcarifer TaxID=8187 RepID=A0A4W6CHG9_LATCA|nr:H-2 class II histocompatibility antigen, E-S beta chain isoform X1 [Lates calcarifer]